MPIRVKGQTSDRHPRREWNSPERRKKRQEEYMEKHGPQEPRRKRLATEDKYKEVREKLKDRGGFKPLRAAKAKGGKAGTGPSPGTRIKARKARAAEWWTGREGMQAVYNPTLDKKLREKRPHSSPEGRMRDVKTAYAKAAAEHKKIKDSGIKRKWGKPKQYGGRPASPNRAKKGIGGLLKKIVSKIKPKPKKGLGSGIKPSEAKDILKSDKITRSEYLKQWSPYFGGRRIKGEKAPNTDILTSPEGKKKTKNMIDKLKKKYPEGFKSKGGRIGLKKGSVHVPGSHSWWLLQQSKPRRSKKASGGRANFRHGGSVGAAVRGHGAEIK